MSESEVLFVKSQLKRSLRSTNTKRLNEIEQTQKAADHKVGSAFSDLADMAKGPTHEGLYSQMKEKLEHTNNQELTKNIAVRWAHLFAEQLLARFDYKRAVACIQGWRPVTEEPLQSRAADELDRVYTVEAPNIWSQVPTVQEEHDIQQIAAPTEPDPSCKDWGQWKQYEILMLSRAWVADFRTVYMQAFGSNTFFGFLKRDHQKALDFASEWEKALQRDHHTVEDVPISVSEGNATIGLFINAFRTTCGEELFTSASYENWKRVFVPTKDQDKYLRTLAHAVRENPQLAHLVKECGDVASWEIQESNIFRSAISSFKDNSITLSDVAAVLELLPQRKGKLRSAAWKVLNTRSFQALKQRVLFVTKGSGRKTLKASEKTEELTIIIGLLDTWTSDPRSELASEAQGILNDAETACSAARAIAEVHNIEKWATMELRSENVGSFVNIDVSKVFVAVKGHIAETDLVHTWPVAERVIAAWVVEAGAAANIADFRLHDNAFTNLAAITDTAPEVLQDVTPLSVYKSIYEKAQTVFQCMEACSGSPKAPTASQVKACHKAIIALDNLGVVSHGSCACGVELKTAYCSNGTVSNSRDTCKSQVTQWLAKARKVLQDTMDSVTLVAYGMKDGTSWKHGLAHDATWEAILEKAQTEGSLLFGPGGERQRIEDVLVAVLNLSCQSTLEFQVGIC